MIIENEANLSQRPCPQSDERCYIQRLENGIDTNPVTVTDVPPAAGPDVGVTPVTAGGGGVAPAALNAVTPFGVPQPVGPS